MIIGPEELSLTMTATAATDVPEEEDQVSTASKDRADASAEAADPSVAGDFLVSAGRYFTPGDVSGDLRTVTRHGGREGDVFYRDRWSHDKVVRSTHGVNCTGSCSWKVYVKDGIITWETQETDYPSVGPGLPGVRASRLPPGAAFSWYTYSPHGFAIPTSAACCWRPTARRRPSTPTRLTPGRRW